MSTYRVEAQAVVPAPAERAYAILADYRNGHPRILPPQFESLEIEEGGVGAGTVIRVRMRVMGKEQKYHLAVTEPEPGRVLAETDIDTGVVTTFTVEPETGGPSCRVTIATELPARGGPLGAIERMVTSAVARRIYARELELLAAVAREGS